LLGPENEPVKVSAFSCQLQKHLPPVDTINAVWQLKSGISGTFACSFGTTLDGDEYTVSCEKGTVTISKGVVTVKPIANSGIETIEAQDMWKGPGIQEEIDAWASGILSGKIDPRLIPEEALMDLRIVSRISNSSYPTCANEWTQLEAMLRSSEIGGVPKEVV
jgi:predicted dehydrogenase